MSRTPTRRIGRLKSTLVLAALAVGMVGGAAAPALAAPPENLAPQGFDKVPDHVEAPDALKELFAGDAEEGEGDLLYPAGWSWFR